MYTHERSSPSIPIAILNSFLKVFFYLLYHQFAWAYDYVAAIVSLGLWKQWVAAVLPHLKGNSILELGHGPGHLQAMLLELGKLSVAVDESLPMNKLAFKKLLSTSWNPLIINGYAQSIPFPDRFFDHVVTTFPTEYIFDPDTLSEIKRVLAPRGTLIVMPVAVFTGTNLPVKAVQLLHHLTGQAPARLDKLTTDRILQPIELAGYHIDIHLPQVGISQVLIAVAHPVDEI